MISGYISYCSLTTPGMKDTKVGAANQVIGTRLNRSAMMSITSDFASQDNGKKLQSCWLLKLSFSTLITVRMFITPSQLPASDFHFYFPLLSDWEHFMTLLNFSVSLIPLRISAESAFEEELLCFFHRASSRKGSNENINHYGANFCHNSETSHVVET